MSGCSSIWVDRDSEGRIERISSLGLIPIKGKIDTAEIDSKMSILDINLVKEGS